VPCIVTTQQNCLKFNYHPALVLYSFIYQTQQDEGLSKRPMVWYSTQITHPGTITNLAQREHTKSN